MQSNRHDMVTVALCSSCMLLIHSFYTNANILQPSTAPTLIGSIPFAADHSQA